MAKKHEDLPVLLIPNAIFYRIYLLFLRTDDNMYKQIA